MMKTGKIMKIEKINEKINYSFIFNTGFFS